MTKTYTVTYFISSLNKNVTKTYLNITSDQLTKYITLYCSCSGASYISTTEI